MIESEAVERRNAAAEFFANGHLPAMTSLPDPIEIQPRGPLHGTAQVPGSKSYTNRALILAALAEGTSHLGNVLHSDDTEYMIAALRELGFTVEIAPGETNATVHGLGGRIPADAADLCVGNSGTTMRFLTALLTLGHGRYSLDGVERMRERPVQPLLDGLNQLGAQTRARFDNGCPPVDIIGGGLRGGLARMAGDLSSQYFTAVLMAAPYATAHVEIDVVGDLVSKPYLDMTTGIMAQFGVTVENDRYRRLVIPAGQRYTAREYEIEADASAASYFFAAPLIAGGKVRVEGIDRTSTQGDIHFLDLLAEMGAVIISGDGWVEVAAAELHGIDCDMNAISDTAQTLAVVAVFADSPTRVRNIAHVRHKETDRIAAVVRELQRCGIAAEETADGFVIVPGTPRPALIATYDDHRMAMSFALLGLRVPGIRIQNPGCVSKTFPDFFARQAQL